ncbi:sushi domain-containing protein 2 [Sparus aurata]|uniref:sushi domain-containing protein 2 n=1 Tax=Sparus aurata TaxID=8175 RepID=UPI0011C105C7|nr:sushi domain-containing protein 2-like [Sparus aurata]
MTVLFFFSKANKRAYLTESIFLCGIVLICSSKTAGQTCRGKCGDILEECSCRATCVSLLNCCADYNQSCFQVTPHSSSMLGGRALRIRSLVLHRGGRPLCRDVQGLWSRGHVLAWHLEQAFRDDSSAWAKTQVSAVGHPGEEAAQLPG